MISNALLHVVESAQKPRALEIFVLGSLDGNVFEIVAYEAKTVLCP